MNKRLFLLGTLFLAMRAAAASESAYLATESQGDSAERESDVEEVIVTGYTASKKADITGAVMDVNLSGTSDKLSGNIMQNLQGKIPGVQITTDGNPNSGATVRIRGQGLGPLGFNDPLYVIDGVPSISGMHELNSNDIQSLVVLRDAASASIYGSRAANGVIIVTTKKGEEGSHFNVHASQSFDDYSFDMRPLNTKERGEVVWRAAVNDGTDPNNASPLYKYDWNKDYQNPELYSVILPTFIDGNKTMRPADTNWFAEVTGPAKSSDLNLSYSSADEDTKIFTSLGVIDRKGIVKSSEFKRVSLRINTEQSFKDGMVRVGENFTITNQLQNQVNDMAGNILQLGIEQQSIVPVHTEDGEGWGGPAGGITDRDNPARIIDINKDNVGRFNKIFGNAYVEVEPLDGLTLRSSYGVNYGEFRFRYFTQKGTAGNLTFSDRLTQSDDWNKTLVWTNTADYKFSLGADHNFEVLAGSETVDYYREYLSGTASGFASQDRDYVYLSQGTSGVLSYGGADAWALQSYFGKVDYSYAGKYLLSATLRKDGSSRFGSSNRWGYFPAVAAGWKISEENFFKLDFVDQLKLRASWGQNGNQEINTRASYDVYESRYATQSLFTTQQDEGTAYDLNGANQGTLPSGFAKTQTGNPDLKWETSTQTNIGLDFDLFDGLVYGSIDAFTKKTADILTPTSPLATEGEGAQMIVNGGTIENKGFELMLGYQDTWDIPLLGVAQVDISGNISKAKNKVIDLPDSVVNSFGGNGQDVTILGRSVNSIYGYVADGLFQSQDDIDSHATQAGAGLGRIRYRDVNNDGVINDKDQTFFTTTDPDYTYGINTTITFGEWDFGMFWQGVKGGSIKNYWRSFTDFTSLNIGSNYGSRTLDAWTPTNTDSDVPALTLVDKNGEGKESSFYWESATYLKLKSLSLGYTLSDFGFDNARIYLSAENLLTIKPRGTLSQDPEAPNNSFPIPRRVTLGLDVNF